MTRFLRRLGPRRLLGAEDGASATEFAIIFPVFILLLFGVFEMARAWWAINTLQHAATMGARYAMTSGASGKPPASTCTGSGSTINTSTFQTNVQAYLQRQVAAYLPSATSTVTATGSCATTPPTLNVSVTVSYNFNFFLSGLVLLNPAGVTFQQKATVTTPLS
jgi:Flp pilus assembly protein TadG